MKVNVRCSKRNCQKRRILPKHPEEYFKFDRKLGEFVNRSPACENCGNNTYRVDDWMNRRNTTVVKCMCNGYVHLTRRVWPHRQGSKYCYFRADGTQRMEGDDDFCDSRLEEYLYHQQKEENEPTT